MPTPTKPQPAPLPRPEPVYKVLASNIEAYKSCVESANTLWQERHFDRIEQIARDLLPSGSGIDAGTKIDIDASAPNKIVLWVEYHHMNGAGSYNGWTGHRITIRPSLAFEIMLAIGGVNTNDIKDYLCETYDDALRHPIVWNDDRSRYIFHEED